MLVYGETGEPQELTFLAEPVKLSVDFSLQREQTAQDGSLLFREYLVKLESVEVAQKRAGGRLHNDLELPYEGIERNSISIKMEKLLDDWFTNGETWHVALRRFGYPGELLVRVYASGHPISNPYGNRVYYDLPVVPGCALHDVRLLPEYELKI